MPSTLARRDPVIGRFEVARKALAKATTLAQAKQLHAIAAAAEVYASQQDLSEEIIGFAHQVKIEALARLGEILKETPRRVGARGSPGPGRNKRGVRQTRRFNGYIRISQLTKCANEAVS